MEPIIKPTYKVIADYPNNIFEVGSIVPMEWNESFNEFEYKDCSRVMLASYFDRFPHLFEKVILKEVDFESNEVRDIISDTISQQKSILERKIINNDEMNKTFTI